MREAPIYRWRLYPEALHGLYVAVNIWPSRTALIRNCHCERKPRHEGCCSSFIVSKYDAEGRARTRMLFAEVHLHAKGLTPEVITHELFHATISWGRRVRFNWTALSTSMKDEERITYVHGRLCAQLMNRLASCAKWQPAS